MKTTSNKRNWVYVSLLLSIGVGALIAFGVLRQRQSGHWFGKMTRDMDERFKSNGLVEVGDNTWRLPRDGETNPPAVNTTNPPNQGAPRK